MKKLSLFVAMLVLAFATVVFAQTIPADKQVIDLKTSWNVEGKQKAVFFKHEVHSKNLACDKCHATPNGGDKIVLEGAIKGTNDKNPAHAWCWGCHKTQEKDPVKRACAKCHTGK